MSNRIFISPRLKDDKNKHGLYINFLKLDNLIIMPSFGQREDAEAEKILNNYYKKRSHTN